ncbi:response regulator transcription factor [Sphingomonas floccifaciens]|uniref:Response regulator transcription factor n=1 Tax=Sphingomonas floccifaciens TaxID=1844115 RepID=A0ABW4N8Z2_9SPHN
MNVLLIEDDPGIGRFVTRGLAAKGYRVAWERDGSRAAALLASNGFSAVLLDLGLPDGDGLDLARSLRSSGIVVPILMLTARGALQDRLDGFAVGADDYLPKPFAFDELVARLAVLIRRGTPAVARPLRFGALELDPERHAARVGPAAVPLSRREYLLLAALVAHGGDTVSRASLSAAVWEDEAVSDNALDVYVGYVRRRLAEQPGAPVIVTVRGTGFRLTDPT